MIAWLVIVFFAVVLTGPAGIDWMERKRAARRALIPAARVIYLPSAVCRAAGLLGRCTHETCAICRSNPHE